MNIKKIFFLLYGLLVLVDILPSVAPKDTAEAINADMQTFKDFATQLRAYLANPKALTAALEKEIQDMQDDLKQLTAELHAKEDALAKLEEDTQDEMNFYHEIGGNSANKTSILRALERYDKSAIPNAFI